MKEIKADMSLIARCGLYCGACGRYLKEKCPGCAKNEKATWCGIRKCCAEKKYDSCADCSTYKDPMQCSLFNNFMSKLFGFIFRSDRKACIESIRKNGVKKYAALMAEKKLQTIKR
jgi:hypothetical protein